MAGTCFIIMPFTDKMDEYYQYIIVPAVKKAGLTPVRADQIYGTGPIIGDIFRGIQSAEIIIADVTGRNPNVNYELGAAHAFRKRVVILSQAIDDVPFDYRHMRVLLYDTTAVRWDQSLELQILRTIQSELCPRLEKDHDGLYTATIDRVYPPLSQQRPGGHIFYRLRGLIAEPDIPCTEHISGENHWLANWGGRWKTRDGQPVLFKTRDAVRFEIEKISEIESYGHAQNVRNIYVRGIPEPAG